MRGATSIIISSVSQCPGRNGFALFQVPSSVKWAVGLAMIPRGEVGLIFAELGKNHEILTDDLYAVLLIVIALTTILTPFAMRYFYRKRPENLTR